MQLLAISGTVQAPIYDLLQGGDRNLERIKEIIENGTWKAEMEIEILYRL